MDTAGGSVAEQWNHLLGRTGKVMGRFFFSSMGFVLGAMLWPEVEK